MGAWIDRFRTFVSRPLPQRLSAQDTNEYQQPQPRLDPMYYLNFWVGNQLPGMFIHVMNPHEQWVSVKDRSVRYQNSPNAAQRTQGSFNYNLGQQGSAEVIAQWRAAWTAAAQAQARR